MKAEQQTIRKLVNNERKFLLTPAANVTVVTRVKGNINYYALEKAINKLKQKHPLISSKIREEGETKYFEYDPTITLNIRSVSRTSESTWIDEIRKENTIPWNHNEGPLIRFILVYSPEISELVVFSQHAICDGTALAFLLRDILLAMDEPEAPVVELRPDFNIVELLGIETNGFGQKLKSIFVNRINNQWRKKQVIFDYDDYLTINQLFNDKYEYGVVFIELDEQQTKQLSETCRSHEVTINSALTGALVYAYHDVFGSKNGKLEIAMPFDLRRRTDPPLDDVFCLLVGSIMVSLKLDGRGFWENVKRIHAETKSKIEKKNVFESALMIEQLDPTLADVIISYAPLAKEVSQEANGYMKFKQFSDDKKNPAIDIAGKFSESLPDLINTNLGRLDFPRKIGSLEIESMYFAPAGSINVPVVAGFLGVSGKVTGTLNYLKPRDAVEDVQWEMMSAIRDKVMEYLGVS